MRQLAIGVAVLTLLLVLPALMIVWDGLQGMNENGIRDPDDNLEYRGTGPSESEIFRRQPSTRSGEQWFWLAAIGVLVAGTVAAWAIFGHRPPSSPLERGEIRAVGKHYMAMCSQCGVVVDCRSRPPEPFVCVRHDD